MENIGNISNKKLSGLLGKRFSWEGDETELTDRVNLDLNKPHMITICGKRGYGKSYTLGVLMEELMELPEKAQDNLSGLVIDPMGIYWSMQQPNTGQDDLLSEWDLESKGYDIKVYYPAGLEDKYEEYGE